MAESTGQPRIRRRTLVWLASYLAVFLLGFAPQYAKARSARKELAAARQELAAAQYRAELGALRDALSLAHLEAVEKNYGLAAQRAAAFFDQLQGLAGRETDAGRREAFQQILAARDGVTAGLANADPAVQSELRRLLRVLHEATSG
jgi:hypothetical protein